eukprot:GEMP01041088.1.p1 GENE.GEMP01041088.1~~GEMP01041088.1.p1  ORF type:complete len:181 (+),score=32.58 GEMP01041088.1:423-965(+)
MDISWTQTSPPFVSFPILELPYFTVQDEASCTTHAANKDTITPLFVRLGGAEVVDALVGAFYDRVILDEKVRHIFGGLDVRKLAQHQTRFLTVAFGGNIGITPIDIREIHEHLGLKDAHFDAVLDNLMLTMIDFGFSEELRDEVFEILEMQRPNVLNLQYYFGVTGEKQSLGCAPTCQLL